MAGARVLAAEHPWLHTAGHLASGSLGSLAAPIADARVTR